MTDRETFYVEATGASAATQVNMVKVALAASGENLLITPVEYHGAATLIRGERMVFDREDALALASGILELYGYKVDLEPPEPEPVDPEPHLAELDEIDDSLSNHR